MRIPITSKEGGSGMSATCVGKEEEVRDLETNLGRWSRCGLAVRYDVCTDYKVHRHAGGYVLPTYVLYKY